jgi:hypothetical protein
LECFFTAEEVASGVSKNHIAVQGITCSAGFHPGRVAERKGKIKELLRELPDSFHKGKGGGMSFLEACLDRHGNQWTGLHQRMDQLFMLGTAIGAVNMCLPREMWETLPGGMPYYVVDVERSFQ